MKKILLTTVAAIVLGGSCANADEVADDRLMKLCYSIQTATAYDVFSKKKQGYTAEASYQKIAGDLKTQMANNPRAIGPGSDAINDFNDALVEHQVAIIRDMVRDADKHPFFNPDKAYPHYAMRCFQEMKQEQEEIASKHKDELKSLVKQGKITLN